MKKNLILLVALLLCRILLPAQNLSAYSTGSIGWTTFSWPCHGADDRPNWLPPSNCQLKERQIKTEYPPYIIGGGWRTYFFTDGSRSSVASHPNSMVSNSELNFKTDGSGPTLISEPSGCTGADPDHQFEPWRYEYYCAYSAQYINHPTVGTASVAFVEGENYELPGVDDPTSDCGSDGVDITTGFLCIAYTPNNEDNNWGHQEFSNIGPIIWPATGYFLPNGYKSSYGCGNNTSIQDNGYVYVFYKDQSYYNVGQSMGPGRLPGIKVARAPISDALNPHAYQTFYEDASGGWHWNQSLPAGFNKDNIKDYYKTPGPQGTTLLESDRDYRRFAVAKVNGTNYYMGLGYFMDPDPNHRWYNSNDGEWYSPEIMTLKYSTDLVHWYGDRHIYSASSYKTTKFNYPIFLNANGWTNTTIDENNFYVIGTNAEENGVNNVVYKMQVYIPGPPPPPPPVCYDQCGNAVQCPAPPPCNDCFCPELRKATTGTAAALDNSKERAPFVSPNPGPGVYQLKYTLKSHARTQLNVLDLMGRQVQTGSAINRMAGTYAETVNISGHAKGVYLLELLVNGKKQIFKVIYQ